MSKLHALMTVTLISLIPMVSWAEDEGPNHFSANVALSTDYRFRGITQTNKDPAISGGLDYSNDTYGFYAGVWASNLDFGVPDPDQATMELDYYGGFSGEVGQGIGWDIGGLYYSYPGSDTGPGAADYDYFEVYGSLSHDFEKFSLTAGLNYSPDYFFGSSDYVYVYGDVGIPLPQGFSLAGHVGHSSIKDNAQFGTPDYLDWKFGVSKEIGAFTFDVSYVDTDIKASECFGGSNFCDATAVFSISASF